MDGAALHAERRYLAQARQQADEAAMPAFVFYLADPCAPIWRGGSLVVLTLRGNQVSVITRFGDRGLLARFGLPRTLPRD